MKDLNYHNIMKAQGKADALDLRSRAPDLDGTAIIAEESKAPNFDPEKDSGMYMSGECCVDGGVVYRCLTDNTVHSPTDYPQAWERV